MHYFVLLLGPETAEEPDAATQAAIMADYEKFYIKAGAAIRAGDALLPSATGVRITGGGERPVITDGPFTEGAEVAGGYFVIEADDLDEALSLAADIPACRLGAVEVWPMVGWSPPTREVGRDWLALLLEPPEKACPPDTEEWKSGVCEHAQFAEMAGDHILAGAPLQLPSTATTVRVRDGQVTLTDGPFAEGAEVANGFYLLRATDRDEAVKLASMIPASTVELRQLAGVGGL